ncbi:MAG: type II toxin-antitoxin system VapC family toxin [Myxococcales bacterium]|nr:type II toxin-antitoxin system VapC family toxin [Myxococcales bacterium]
MPRLLLDTHTFLWWVTDSTKLSSTARHAIEAADAQVFLSVVSAWEMAIKQSLGRLTLPFRADLFVVAQAAHNRFELLRIEARHTGRIATMPHHHRDPFDRMLVAQALEEGLTIVSADVALTEYEAKVLW